MRVKPPEHARLQCEVCGVPVETLEALGFVTGTMTAVCRVEPCGHDNHVQVNWV